MCVCVCVCVCVWQLNGPSMWLWRLSLWIERCWGAFFDFRITAETHGFHFSNLDHSFFPHVIFIYVHWRRKKKPGSWGSHCSEQSSMYWQDVTETVKTCPIVGNSHSHQWLSGAIHSPLIGKGLAWQANNHLARPEPKLHSNERWRQPSVATKYILILLNSGKKRDVWIVFTFKQNFLSAWQK